MKKLISVIALALVLCTCLAAFSGCAKKAADGAPSGMKLASGDVDYCLYVPEEWKVDRADSFTSAYFGKGNDPSNVSVTAYAISTDIATVEDWWKIFEERMTSEIYTEVGEIKKTDVTLGGIEGCEYTFTGKLGEQEWNVTVTAVIKDFYVYYLTYTSVPQFIEDHTEEHAQIINSFKFKD